MKLKDAIKSIENQQAEAHLVDLERKRNALDDIAPVITLIKDTFKEDGLKGWDTPTYCSGIAHTRFWLEGRFGHVFMDVDSRFPERVVVFRGNIDRGVNTFPTTDEGISHMVTCVAERMMLGRD